MVPDSDSALLPVQQKFGRYLQALPAAAQLGLLSTGGGLPPGSLVKQKKAFMSPEAAPRLFAFLVSVGWIVSMEKGLPCCWKHSLVSGAGQPRVPTWTVASQGGGRSLPWGQPDSGAAAPGLGWLCLAAPGTVTRHPDLFC